MCASWVRRHTWIFITDAVIRAFRSAKSRGNGGTNTIAHFARNALCTVTTDLLVPYSNTQNERPFSHYIQSHRLAAEMWNTAKKT